MANPLWEGLFGRHVGRQTPLLLLDGGATITHAGFLSRAARIAHALGAFDVGPGDRVAMQVAKSPDALALVAACAATGAVVLPLNTAYTPVELAYFVENAGARLLVCDPASEAALAPVATQAGAALATLGSEGEGSLADVAAGMPESFEPVPRSEDDLAAILYTSGTTGRSKGAMLTQRNLLSNAEALRACWRFTDRDVLLHALPIFHTHGLFVATNVALLAGCPMVFLPKFDADTVIRWLPRATSMMGVPTFYTRLLDDPRLDRDLVAHIRLFVSGSAPLLAETHRAWEARTGHRILERYGMTETGMNTSNPYEGERRAGTVGFPLPGVEVRVADPETRAEVARGEVGQIEVRGPNVFAGYWGMPEKTAEELKEDRFFLTGDMGMIDADGYVHIVGRAKDLIISGGFNIYPREIELLIDALPGVDESAVIGVPHADFGEGVVAVVVPDKGGGVTPEAVLAGIAGSLARFKQPKAVVVVPELPRNAMGKVQKAELRKTYADCLTD